MEKRAVQGSACHAGSLRESDRYCPRVGWPVIPVLTAPDDMTVQDTTDIIDYVEAHVRAGLRFTQLVQSKNCPR